MTDPNFQLGAHSASIERLVKGQDEIFDRLGDIEKTLNIRAGERAGVKMVAAIIAFCTSVGGTLLAMFVTGRMD